MSTTHRNEINVQTTRCTAEGAVFDRMSPRTFKGQHQETTDDWETVQIVEDALGAGSIGAYVKNAGANSIDVRLAFRGRDGQANTPWVPASGAEVALTLAAGAEGYLWSLVKLVDVAVQVKSAGAGAAGKLVWSGGIA